MGERNEEKKQTKITHSSHDIFICFRSSSVYQREKQFVTGPSFKTFKTVNTSRSRTYQDVENSNEETSVDRTSFGQVYNYM